MPAMDILVDIGWLVAGLAALYFGAEWLVNAAAKISLKFGISPLAVGLTVVAFGTSAPELFVSLNFNKGGNPDMAIGNVIGSNICNIGMVLGISAFICSLTIHRTLLQRDMTFLIASSLVFILFLWNGEISRIEGALMFLAVVCYTILRLRIARKETASEAAVEVLTDVGSVEEAQNDPNWKLVLLVLGGLVVLYFGSQWLELGGVSLAERLGVPGAIISLTVIAFSTSVPELATSIVASLKREGDLITGNIVGSCIFNLLCVVGVTSMVQPIVAPQFEKIDLFVMLSFVVILVPMMLSRMKVTRVEGSMLLIGYVWYCVYLWMHRIEKPATAMQEALTSVTAWA